MTPLKKRRITRDIIDDVTNTAYGVQTPPSALPPLIPIKHASPRLLSPSSAHQTSLSFQDKAPEDVDAAHMLLSLTGSGTISKILGRSQMNGMILPGSPPPVPQQQQQQVGFFSNKS